MLFLRPKKKKVRYFLYFLRWCTDCFKVVVFCCFICLFQAKILCSSTFSEDERRSVKSMIQINVHGYLGILLEAREQFEGECFNEMRKRHINQPGP